MEKFEKSNSNPSNLFENNDTQFSLKKGMLHLLQILGPVLVISTFFFYNPSSALAAEVGVSLKKRIAKVKAQTYLELLDNLQEIIVGKIPAEIRLGHPSTAIQKLFKNQHSLLDATVLILGETQRQKNAISIVAVDLMSKPINSWPVLIPMQGKKQMMIRLLKSPKMNENDYKKIASHVAAYLKPNELSSMNRLLSLRAGVIFTAGGVSMKFFEAIFAMTKTEFGKWQNRRENNSSVNSSENVKKFSQFLSSNPVFIPFVSMFVILTKKKNQQNQTLLEEIVRTLGFEKVIEDSSNKGTQNKETRTQKAVSLMKLHPISFGVLFLLIIFLPALLILSQKQNRNKIVDFFTNQKTKMVAVFQWLHSQKEKKLEEKIFLDHITEKMEKLEKEVIKRENDKLVYQKKNQTLIVEKEVEKEKTFEKVVNEDKVINSQKNNNVNIVPEKSQKKIEKKKTEENSLEHECLKGQIDSCRKLLREMSDAAHDPRDTIGMTDSQLKEFELLTNKAIEDILDSLSDDLDKLEEDRDNYLESINNGLEKAITKTLKEED